MGLLKEFKEFAMRGNVVDLAVGVIMGTSFSTIVNSLVKDVVMPPIGYLIARFNLGDLKFDLIRMKLIFEAQPAAAKAAAAAPGLAPAAAAPATPAAADSVMINIGSFLQASINFVIIAFCVFLLVKGMNTLWKKKQEQPKSAELSTQEKLLAEIRDLLQGRTPPHSVPSPQPGEP